MTKEYGRRPYAEKDNRLTPLEREKAVTDKAMFNQKLEKQSEFKKPYQTDDYQEMEYWYPAPMSPLFMKLPGTALGLDFPGSAPETGEWYITLPCNIRCKSSFKCDGPVECYPMAWTGDKKALKFRVFIKEGKAGAYSKYTNWVYYPSLTTDELKENPKPATAWPLRINAPEGGWNSFPDNDRHYISVTMYDPNGECTDEVGTVCYSVGCCDDGGYVAPSIVAGSTDDTIDDSTPATVTIQDGCPPYTWGVSGTGFTIVPDGSSDSLSAVVTASSGCGVATVTVTDYCGTVVTKKILHTTGTWVSQGNVCGMSGAFDTRTWNGSGYDLVKVSGDQKQLQTVQYEGHTDADQCTGDCAGVDFSSSAWCNGWGYEAQGICIWTYHWCTCQNIASPVGCDSYRNQHLEHFHWGCA